MLYIYNERDAKNLLLDLILLIVILYVYKNIILYCGEMNFSFRSIANCE